MNNTLHYKLREGASWWISHWVSELVSMVLNTNKKILVSIVRNTNNSYISTCELKESASTKILPLGWEQKEDAVLLNQASANDTRTNGEQRKIWSSTEKLFASYYANI
ncbi:hypothetical protein CEXT_217201 [Caerostris extrusa]|uniref:Uncharacterized protein n=1 Tax=Caerostris extrusa TaxID=172846 RepID=A0AAV4UFD7_CAEEX|nr:hypothetical protein CEXT_217201 [Caerostris extrusa]